jgi:YfiH family protein
MSAIPSLTNLDEEVLELPGGGRALFSARAHGNLSSVGGEHAEHGLQVREHLRQALGVQRLLRGYQVHGSIVGRVYGDGSTGGLAGAYELEDGAGRPDFEGHRPPDGARRLVVGVYECKDSARRPVSEVYGRHDSARQPALEADGHAVAAPAIAAMVLTADCIPVVLGAEGAVAALHAGWRGLANGVLEEGVRALREVGGKGEVSALVGPCAGACCYEVGEEVHGAFGGVPIDDRRDRRSASNGRLIELRAIAHERLLAAGVAHVQDVAACTICDERYFSHRREGVRAGRQGAVAWLS